MNYAADFFDDFSEKRRKMNSSEHKTCYMLYSNKHTVQSVRLLYVCRTVIKIDTTHRRAESIGNFIVAVICKLTSGKKGAIELLFCNLLIYLS